MPEKRRVNFSLIVYGSTDRETAFEWGHGVAKFLQDELNEQAEMVGWERDVTVEVEDGGEGG